MRKRLLGRSGLEVSAVGLGCMGLSYADPRTTKLHRLEENLCAADIELSRDDLRRIEAALAAVDVQGARYPAPHRS